MNLISLKVITQTPKLGMEVSINIKMMNISILIHVEYHP